MDPCRACTTSSAIGESHAAQFGNMLSIILPVNSHRLPFTAFHFGLICPLQCREEGPNGSQGGGAVLLVIKGTAHHTFTDVVPYFHARFGWLTRMVTTSQRLKSLTHASGGHACIRFTIHHLLGSSLLQYLQIAVPIRLTC